MIVPPNQGRIEKMLGNLRLCLINGVTGHVSDYPTNQELPSGGNDFQFVVRLCKRETQLSGLFVTD